MPRGSSELTRRRRQAAIELFLYGIPQHQIARALGISDANVIPYLSDPEIRLAKAKITKMRVRNA